MACPSFPDVAALPGGTRPVSVPVDVAVAVGGTGSSRVSVWPEGDAFVAASRKARSLSMSFSETDFPLAWSLVGSDFERTSASENGLVVAVALASAGLFDAREEDERFDKDSFLDALLREPRCAVGASEKELPDSC